MIHPGYFVSGSPSFLQPDKHPVPGSVFPVFAVPAGKRNAPAVFFHGKRKSIYPVQPQFVFVPVVAPNKSLQPTPNTSRRFL